MFTPSSTPRLFALPPGVDFCHEVAQGVLSRMQGQDPAALARVRIYVPNHRMQKRLREVFVQSGTLLLPQLRLVTDPGADPTLSDQPAAVPELRRRLELTTLIARLLDTDPDLAPKSSLFALSDSLATLLSEMNSEGVSVQVLEDLDISDESGHWARALNFVKIAHDYLTQLGTGPDAKTRLRAAVMTLVDVWRTTPPETPVILAGSTGSRGLTAHMIRAIAQLPQGAVILPGVDTDMPPHVWRQLDNPLTGEDHPQFRFARLADDLGLDVTTLPRWNETAAPCPPRNALVSLALRPAPVTDDWRRDGPNLTDLDHATQNLTLVEAPSPRIEAETIALRLRQAVEDGITAALITPDRTLTRQVAAALDRWNITPDDSAGVPLHLTAVGRLLRHSAEFLTAMPDAQGLLTLLKHPLTHTGEGRGQHLLWTRMLEMSLRRDGPPYPNRVSMLKWAENTPEATDWADWVCSFLQDHSTGQHPLPDLVARHIAMTERLASGPGAPAETLWDGDAGQDAQRLMADLQQHAEAGTDMTPRDYLALITTVLQGKEVRTTGLKVHPNVLIWGTQEARSRSADMIILGGLNEGSWPEMPGADPWLNRRLRAQAGMLLPDRTIGLSAHDFQMAIAGEQVWITRSLRSEDAETVPSRWLNRLTNLLGGLPDGKPCLEAMRTRGAKWVAMAEAQGKPTQDVKAAPRPSPCPPVSTRPRRFRITDISHLLRDPYAIYAREILRLTPIDPLIMNADARIKGTAVHEVMERLIQDRIDPAAPDAKAQLLEISQQVLTQHCPWPTARVLWQAQMQRNAATILTAEAARRQRSSQIFAEIDGVITLPDVNITLRGRADRIDLDDQGRAWVYDYKTGAPPSVKAQKVFDKQLLIEAAMVERGGFPDIGPSPVAGAAYLQIGAKITEVPAPLDDHPPDAVWADLHTIFRNWDDPSQGYTARRAAEKTSYAKDYDQLARYGEWDTDTLPVPEEVK